MEKANRLHEIVIASHDAALFDNGEFKLSRFCQRFHRRIGVKIVRRIVNNRNSSVTTNDELLIGQPTSVTALSPLLNPPVTQDFEAFMSESIIDTVGQAFMSETVETVG